jgi:hypothetical protein
MFCPKCGTTNDNRPSFCRQCGLSLTGIQLGVEGRVDEAIAKFKKSEDLLATGLVIFTVFVIGALVSLFLTGVYPFAISIGIGLIISVPIVLLGLIRVDRVRRLLDPEEKHVKLIEPTGGNPNFLPPAATTDALPTGPVAPGSVTEQTTINLKHPTRR